MTANFLARLVTVVGVATATALVSAPSHASVVLDTHGFEQPYFSTTFNPGTIGSYNGQLEGQPISPPNETWERSMDPGGSQAFVQNTVFAPGGGTQAVQLNRAVNSNIRWGVPLSGLPAPGADKIVVAWDMRVEGPAGTNGPIDPQQFGPFFGVETYAAPGGGLTVLGTWGVDATTGEVLYQATGSGAFVAPGPTVAFGVWNTFQLLLDYSTKTYSGFLNGALVVSGIGFVDGAFTTFSDADISGIDAGSNLAGTAYFDNFTVSAVPELPAAATWALLAAMAGLACWWKKPRPQLARVVA
jgi:hypothetical protein